MPGMLFKEDWEQAKRRFDAFWEGEIIDRCCLAVTAPREKALDSEALIEEAENLDRQWLDSEYRYRQAIFEYARTFYGGEAFPASFINLGPGVIAACVGSDYMLRETTVWFGTQPMISAWDPPPVIEVRKDSAMHKTLVAMTERFAAKAQGNYMVGISDLGGNLDILASLRGTSELLCDLLENPGPVKQALEQIDDAFCFYFSTLAGIIDTRATGCTTWMPLWCRQDWYPLQCDFSAMISPLMFEKFVVPALMREAGFLQRAIYHLDGPGALPHIDLILEIPGIQGIQWTSGAKINSAEDVEREEYDLANPDWFPLYRKIQQKGKNLVLLGARPRDVKTLVQTLSPEGLFISTRCDTEEEARSLLQGVQQWSRRQE